MHYFKGIDNTKLTKKNFLKKKKELHHKGSYHIAMGAYTGMSSFPYITNVKENKSRYWILYVKYKNLYEAIVFTLKIKERTTLWKVLVLLLPTTVHKVLVCLLTFFLISSMPNN